MPAIFVSIDAEDGGHARPTTQDPEHAKHVQATGTRAKPMRPPSHDETNPIWRAGLILPSEANSIQGQPTRRLRRANPMLPISTKRSVMILLKVPRVPYTDPVCHDDRHGVRVRNPWHPARSHRSSFQINPIHRPEPTAPSEPNTIDLPRRNEANHGPCSTDQPNLYRANPSDESP